jgi:hypothetical protein
MRAPFAVGLSLTQWGLDAGGHAARATQAGVVALLGTAVAHRKRAGRVSAAGA